MTSVFRTRVLINFCLKWTMGVIIFMPIVYCIFKFYCCYYSESFDHIGGVNGVGKDNLFKLFQHWGTPFKGELKKVIFLPSS